MNTPITEEYRQQAEALRHKICDCWDETSGWFIKPEEMDAFIATALQAAADGMRVEEAWQNIADFPKDAETGSHWEVMAILDGGHRHLIVRWFGGQQGFSTLGVCGFEVTHFRIARSPFVQNQQS